jgi:DNA-binding MarR family transcriptional regulator
LSNQTRDEVLHELFWEIRAQQTAVDAVDEAAAAYFGVNRTDFRCIDILDRDGPMTAGALAAASRLSPGAVTALIDRLERAGYARRTRDEIDRRRVLVEITDELRQLGRQVYGDEADYVPFFDRYTYEELVLLRDFTRGGRIFNEQQQAKIEALRAARDAEAAPADPTP